MSAIDLQSDDFMILLTDALRAGPGSPEWQRAVTTLKDAGASGDEYSMLITAREHLTSGQSYRAIRAGPGFTRSVMEQVDRIQPARAWSGSPAVWIAAAAALLVSITIGLALYVAVPGGLDADSPGTLERTYFVQPRVEVDFSGALGDAWLMIGQLPVQTDARGLRLSNSNASPDRHLGGGVARQPPLPADQPFLVEARLRATRLSVDLIPQVFITDTPEFTADRGTSPHELVWLIQSGQPSVALPDGRLAGQSAATVRQARDGMTIRIAINRHHAIVDSDGERIFTGAHQLSPDRPRYVGVRFLKKGDADPTQVRFESLRILQPQDSPSR